MTHPTITPTNMEPNTKADHRTATEIMDESKDLYAKKNDDYGDSWRLVGKTMTLWLNHQGVDELRIPVNSYTMNALGLFTRRLDKMIREFNGWFCLEEGENFKVDESIAETHQDDVPYSAMHTELAERYANADADEFLP